ncbi:MAG: peptidoglycan-associated outer membrane protein [Chlorobi bacterium OLB5]|nr:MAG: peptidoglycan-associated outer membrane protein [Chlorobi bacterium OLB5]
MPEKNVLTVKGRITDENAKPLDAVLLWYDINANKNAGSLTSDPETGKYIITLPNGTNYSYFAERSGYYSVSNNIDLSSQNEFSELIVDIVLNSVQSLQNTAIVLNNIYFDFDKFDLMEASFTELNRVVKFLNDNPGVKIEISAHTDSKGSDDYNLSLSQKRAESVVNYLVQQGVDPSRLTARGYGESLPVADNATDEGAAKNRRVEMKVLN